MTQNYNHTKHSHGHGGERPGAGRPPAPTTQKRIPNALLPTVEWMIELHRKGGNLPPGMMKFSAPGISLAIPLAQDRVRAGFPSPAESYISDELDFNQYLVHNPMATFAAYSGGLSMVDAGIGPKDLMICDRSLDPTHGDIIIANVDNAFTVKRLAITATGIELRSENESDPHPNIIPTAGSEGSLVAVVTFSIRQHKFFR